MKGWYTIVVALMLTASVVMAEPSTGHSQTIEREVRNMQEVHENFSVEYFNSCWKMINKPNRSPDDEENMLLLAYASLWHWKERDDCTPLNLSIGYWQVSRVNVLAGHYEMAKLFGEKCLRISRDNSLSPFYVGYGHEALARAEMLGENLMAARKHLAEAQKQLDGVMDKEASELLRADLAELETALSRKGDKHQK